MIKINVKKLAFTMLILQLFVVQVVFAQYEKDYTPIKSTGNIPDEFIKLSSEKYNEQLKDIDKKSNDAKAEQKLILESTFEIDDILLSGKVLFNDPMSNYCNKVVDKVLENNPSLRSNIKVYVIQVPYVNAFTTSDGHIFITTGLLAQVETEAQLALIVCHEIIHYTEKHSLEAVKQEEKFDKRDSEYKNLSRVDKLIAQSNFSILNEKEADAKGLELFLKTSYSTSTVLGTFDVLQYSYLPFDDVKFSKTFLENRILKIPNEWTLDYTNEISGYEDKLAKANEGIDDGDDDNDEVDEDELYKTHPDVDERRDLIRDKIKVDNTGKSTYLVSESELNSVREMARFELSYLYAIRHEYVKCIYNSFLLQKKYPDNLYLKRMIAFSMSSLSAYSSEGEISEVTENYKEIEGKQQSLYYLIDKLDSSSKVFSIYALAYCAEQKLKYPEDRDLDHYFQVAVRTLVYHTNITYGDFSSREPIIIDSTKVDTVKNIAVIEEEVVKEDEEKMSKYDKIRKKEVTPITIEEVKTKQFYEYAFVDYYSKDWFKNSFIKYQDQKEKNQAYKNLTRKEQLESRKIDLDKVVIINPYYLEINERDKDEVKYIESEQKENDLIGLVEDVTKMNKIDYTFFNMKGISVEDSKKLSDYTFMRDYMIHDLQNGSDVVAPNINYSRAQDIMKEQNAKYIAFFGVISYTEKTHRIGGLYILSILFPPAMVATIPAIINHRKHTIFTSVIYNTEKGKVEDMRQVDVRNRTTNPIIASQIYDVYYSLKKNNKSTKK
jgi:hypothetical protein